MSSNSRAGLNSVPKQDRVETCHICGADAAITVRSRNSPILDATYKQWKCRDCGSAFFVEHEHAIDLQAAYEDFYRTTNDIERGREFRRRHYWRHEISVIRKLHGNNVRSVLDIGCHHGDFLLHWPEDVKRVGSELAPSCAEIARSRSLNVVDGHIEDADFEEEFDVVACYAVIEHLRDPVTFLQTLPRLTAANGIVAVLIPTVECLKRWLLDLTPLQWHMFTPPLHLSFLSRSFLDRLMQQQGFRLVDRRYAAGGMFNPLRRLPIVGTSFARGMAFLDSYGPTRRIPIFDHMYSYYAKR